MHICFITSEFPKIGYSHGGIGTFVATLGKALVEKGVRVSVIGINYSANEEIESVDGINVYRLTTKKIKGLQWFLNTRNIAGKLKEVHRQNPIDCVETAELGLAFIPKIKEIKYIIRLHGGHHFFAESENRKVNWWKGYQEKRSFKKADAFIAVSEYVKTHTAKYLSYNGKPIYKIYCPINIFHFHPLDIKPDTNNITFVGTICEKKGVRQLILAFPLIKEKFPNAVLNLYGRDWFFPDGSSYIKMLKETELPKLGTIEKDILFHGVVSIQEIPLVYSKATVCVFPSHMETLGLVAPEAMAMQKAVVFTKLGPGKEVITHGETGLLCNPYDSIDIAEKIIQLLSDNDLVNYLGLNARKAVLEKFDIDTIVTKNIDFYRELLSR